MEIKIEFENPLFISFELEADSLEITFEDENLFISSEGIMINEQDRTLERKLSR